MNTPSLPHLDVGDAWSSGVGRVHDLAGAAVDVLEDVPERALALAGAVIPSLRPARRSRRPFVVVGVAAAAAVLVVWLMRRRDRSTASSATPGIAADRAVPAAS